MTGFGPKAEPSVDKHFVAGISLINRQPWIEVRIHRQNTYSLYVGAGKLASEFSK